MSQLYQITFKQLSDTTQQQTAEQLLQKKLKLSPSQVSRFFNREKVFNPMPLDKAKRQQKLFMAMGISLTASAVAKSESTTSTSRQAEVDERILAALDYITTSIIRLEEKVDELSAAQSIEQETIDHDEVNSSSWGDDIDFDESEVKKSQHSKFFPYLIATLVGLLLIVLSLLIAFPELSPIK